MDGELGKTCMYTNLCVHTYLHLFLYIKLGLHLYLCDSGWICFDLTIFADGLDIECEKRVVKGLQGFWLENQKDGDVIVRDVKIMGRAGFWEEFRNDFWTG